MSNLISPVTQVAEVEVKNASEKSVNLPIDEAIGKESKTVPKKIINKYPNKISRIGGMLLISFFIFCSVII